MTTKSKKTVRKPANKLRARLRASLRQVWLRSPERAEALKRDNYTCQAVGCGKKQSKRKGHEVKVQVHHIAGIMDWNEVLDFIMASGLFCDRKYLVTRCKECHKLEAK